MAKSDSLSDSGSPRDQQSEPPVSGFTAVNGREQSSSTAGSSVMNGSITDRKGSDERPNGQNGSGQPRINPPGQERLTLSTNTRREEWNTTQNAADATTQPQPHGQGSAPYPDVEGRHKRKRSGSEEKESSMPNSYHSHAMPKSPPRGTPQDATSASEPQRDTTTRPSHYSETRDYYESPSQPYSSNVNDNRDNAQNGWPSHSNQDHRSPYESTHNGQSQSVHSTDDRMMSEALRREIHGDPHSAHSQNGYGTSSPGDDDNRSSNYGNGYGQDQTSVQIQADMKKRKRNFSNRTKTGCMTCRKRKKKCDEGRPECT